MSAGDRRTIWPGRGQCQPASVRSQPFRIGAGTPLLGLLKSLSIVTDPHYEPFREVASGIAPIRVVVGSRNLEAATLHDKDCLDRARLVAGFAAYNVDDDVRLLDVFGKTQSRAQPITPGRSPL